MRPTIVAEAPGRARKVGGRALDGPSGDRLASYVGSTRGPLLEAFDTRNLVGRWPGPAPGKGAAWPAALARRNALRAPLRGVCVLLGRRVAAAYGLGSLDWWTWLSVGGADGWLALVAVIPHPSGVCREYNDPLARARARNILLQALRVSDSGATFAEYPERRSPRNEHHRMERDLPGRRPRR